MYKITLNKMPELSRCGKFKQINKWSDHDGRKISCNLLIIMSSGEADFKVNDISYLIKKGDIFFIPKNTFYKPSLKTECEYYFFRFDNDIEEIKIDDEFLSNYYCLPVSYQFELPKTEYNYIVLPLKMESGSCFNNIQFQIQNCFMYKNINNKNGKLLMDVIFTNLLITLSDINFNNLKNTKKNPSVLEKIILYIKENYTKKITLTDLSEKYLISKQYIIRLFKKHLNITATHFINKEKLNHAVELLLYSNMNVQQVSEHLAFENFYYFSRVFKQEYTLSPTKWLKEKLNNNS